MTVPPGAPDDGTPEPGQPLSREARFQFADAYAAHRDGKPARAHALCLAILETHPEHADTLHLLAQVARAAGNPGEALAFLERAIRRSPKNHRLYNDAGLLLAHFGLHGDALNTFRLAADLAPEAVAPVVNRANVLARMQRTDEAIDAYREALRLEPGHLGTLTNLAVLFEAEGRLKAAHEATRKGLALQRREPTLNLVAARLERRAGHHEKGLRRLARMLEAEPPPAVQIAIQRELGMLHDARREFGLAVDAFKRANRLNVRMLRGHASAAALDRRIATEHRWLDGTAGRPPRGRTGTVAGHAAPVVVVGFPGSGTHRLAAMLQSSGAVPVGLERPLWAHLEAPAGKARDLEALREKFYAASPSTPSAPFVEVLSLGALRLRAIAELLPDARYVYVRRNRADTLLTCLTGGYGAGDAAAHLLSAGSARALQAAVAGLWERAAAALELDVFEVDYEPLLDADGRMFERVSQFICGRPATPAKRPNRRMDDESQFEPGHARHYVDWLEG